MTFHRPAWCVLCMKALEFDPESFGNEPTTLPDGCVAHVVCWDAATAEQAAVHAPTAHEPHTEAANAQ